MTSNESAASAPWAAGSVSGGIIFSISTNVLGQPCVMISGIGFGPFPRAWMKWTPSPSTSARYWGKALMAASCARQSKPSAQYSQSSLT